MLRSVLLTLACVVGCSSSDFQVAGDATNDSGTTDDVIGTETSGETSVDDTMPVDTKPDPCAADPDKAKFCIDVSVPSMRPSYPATEAGELQIDGKGRVFVFFYDKDPLEGTVGSPAKVIASIQYPPESEVGAEIAVGDLPITISGSVATPGTYTAIAFFADSKKTRGTGANGVLPGDFVTIATPTAAKFAYPKLTLAEGTTAKITMPMRAVRGVLLTVTPTAGLKKSTTVHGDGPVIFGLHDDAELTSATKWEQLDNVGCVDLDIDKLAPRAQDVMFNTIATKTHNIFVAVIDYSATEPSFPGRGSLISAQGGALPKLEIKPDSWRAKANVDLVDVAFGAVPLTTMDNVTCPAAL